MHMRCNECERRLIKDGCHCKDCNNECRKHSPEGNTNNQWPSKNIKPGKSVEADWKSILDIKNMSEQEMYGLLSALFDEIFTRVPMNSVEKRKIEILLSQSEKSHRDSPEEIYYVEKAALRPGEWWKTDKTAEKSLEKKPGKAEAEREE